MGGLKGQATYDLWVGFTPSWVAALHRFRHLVGTFWCIIMMLGVYHGESTIRAITSDLAVIEGRPQPAFMRDSLQAAAELKTKFPSLAGEKAIVRVRRLDRQFVLSEKTESFCKSLAQSVDSFRPDGVLLGVDSIYNYWKPTWASNRPPHFVKELFLTEGDSSMLMVIYLNMSYSEHLDYYVEAIRNMVTLAELQLAGPVVYEVFLGGDLTMRQDLSIAVQADAAFVHSLTLPIATALLALFFRSLRIMLLPLVTIALSVSSSLLVMYSVSRVLPLHYLVPGLLTCVTLACSVDYCLFFLARLKDELCSPPGGAPNFHAAVLTSTANGGYTILTSGLGLAVGFLGLCFFPIDAVVCTGLASAVTILAIIVINLTVIPCLLVSFPDFWMASWAAPGLALPLDGWPSHQAAPGAGKPEADGLSGWAAYGWWVVEHRVGFLLAALVFGVVVSPEVLTTKYTSSPQAVFPNGYASMDFARELIDSYGEGRIWPYYLVLDARNGSVYSDSFFEAAGDFLREVNATLARNDVAVQSVIGLMYLNGEYVKWTELQSMLHFADGDCGARERKQIQMQLGEASRLIGKQVSTTMSEVTTLIDANRPHEAAPAGTAPPAAGPRPLMDQDDLDRLAMGAGLFFGHLVKESAIVAETVHAHPHETLAPTVTALSHSVGEGATQASDAIIVGAKASGALCLNIVEMLKHYVANNASTVVVISLHRPYGREAASWLVEFNGLLGELAEQHPLVAASVSGFGLNYLALQMYTLSWFPWVVGFTAAAISLILFLSYRSAVLAVRSAATNLFSISVVFGTLSLVYSDTVGVSWMVPIITFSILIGLNMDYDVFLITGILSARSAGQSNAQSIVSGLEHNGTVIGVAGLIMASAFSGLLFSSTVMNQQLALVILVGIFFDTVFLQSMLVPALMASLGDYNWWPASFVPAHGEAGGDESPGRRMLDGSERSHHASGGPDAAVDGGQVAPPPAKRGGSGDAAGWGRRATGGACQGNSGLHSDVSDSARGSSGEPPYASGLL